MRLQKNLWYIFERKQGIGSPVLIQEIREWMNDNNINSYQLKFYHETAIDETSCLIYFNNLDDETLFKLIWM